MDPTISLKQSQEMEPRIIKANNPNNLQFNKPLKIWNWKKVK